MLWETPHSGRDAHHDAARCRSRWVNDRAWNANSLAGEQASTHQQDFQAQQALRLPQLISGRWRKKTISGISSSSGKPTPKPVPAGHALIQVLSTSLKRGAEPSHSDGR